MRGHGRASKTHAWGRRSSLLVLFPNFNFHMIIYRPVIRYTASPPALALHMPCGVFCHASARAYTEVMILRTRPASGVNKPLGDLSIPDIDLTSERNSFL